MMAVFSVYLHQFPAGKMFKLPVILSVASHLLTILCLKQHLGFPQKQITSLLIIIIYPVSAVGHIKLYYPCSRLPYLQFFTQLVARIPSLSPLFDCCTLSCFSRLSSTVLNWLIELKISSKLQIYIVFLPHWLAVLHWENIGKSQINSVLA